LFEPIAPQNIPELNSSQYYPPAVRKAWNRARGRALKRGSVFTLTADDVSTLWERCDGKCSVSGMEFTEEIFPNALVKRPFAPSLDQIEANKGYTLENTRITCVAANFAMNEWGLDVLQRLARAIAKHEQQDREPNAAWYDCKRAALMEAEKAANGMVGELLLAQKHRIAGLKAAITMGPVRLSEIAQKASGTKVKKAAGTG